jgi:thiaminase
MFINFIKLVLIAIIAVVPMNLFANNIEHEKLFATENYSSLFQSLEANDAIIKLWRSQFKYMKSILSSKMVQGMKKSTLTQKDFDELYMKPDVIYIYRLGVETQKRAEKMENLEYKLLVNELADMFLGYQTKHNRFEKYNLNLTDILDDKIVNHHLDLISNKLTDGELIITLLTDMMPYVCFANYLYHNIVDQNNIWFNYAKKYGTFDSEYAQNKLKKTIKIANQIIDSNVVDIIRASELFEEGMYFEEYFIKNAMNGNLLKKIKQKK